MQSSQTPFLSNLSQGAEPRAAEVIKLPGELWAYFLLPALLHIPLVFLLRAASSLGLLYVLLLFVVGLFQLKHEKPDALILVCGYIASAELIWRMTNAPVFWETGKYMLIFLMGLGIFRWKSKLAIKPFLYFLALIPSVFLTLNLVSLVTAREYLSFNLSGPLLIGVAAIFFSGLHLSRLTLNRMLLLALVPITSVWMIAINSMLSADQLLFTNYSNFTTSGGYGPNQVSALLGLGVLYCWLYLFTAHPKGKGYWLIIGVALALLVQAILTFSRGGVFNLAFAIPAATLFFTRGQKLVQRRIFGALVLIGLALFFLIPKLNEYTAGMLVTRFEDLSLSGREQIMRSDLQLWSENPILGVGAGISSMMRGELASVIHAASHTEYTRLLAEHGSFGLVAILLLFSMVWQAFRQARGGLAKGTALGLSFWALAEMVHAAMRIAAISYVFALPLAQLELEDE